jgi:hypothetical protein
MNMPKVSESEALEAVVYAMLNSNGDKTLLESLAKLAKDPKKLAQQLSSSGEEPSNGQTKKGVKRY